MVVVPGANNPCPVGSIRGNWQVRHPGETEVTQSATASSQLVACWRDFLALWAFLYMQETSALIRTLGIIGISGTCLMPVYGVLFYRKACRLHL